ncbi:Ig-like domain-containing protein [Bacillus cereus]|uniref:phage tail tube protein n=1 Tax=Bacillus cereus TaxID=1396 RepID=UPI00203EB11F|nr:Ig-like domain-containing protein [Bacillus cereus]MCM3223334.1 Ig-like domain-containing protein [Bacillus cereus]
MRKRGFMKNHLFEYYIGPVSEFGDFAEDTLMRLGRGITTVDPDNSEDSEDYEYYDLNGGKETDVTSMSLSHGFSGNRYYGDPALEFIRNMLTKMGARQCSFRVIEPDGRVLEGVATVSEITPYGGDANARTTFEFKVTFVGLPRDEHPNAPTTITITPDTTEVEVGAKTNLAAAVLPEEAIQDVIWSSGDETKAIVDPKGKVTGVAEGTTVIVASSIIDPTIKGTCTVTVTAATVKAKANLIK